MTEGQFYARFILNIILGLMFVYALIKMAKHNNQETKPTKHSVMKVFGWIFAILSILLLVSCLINIIFHLDFPSNIKQVPLGAHTTVHPSSSILYWGQPTPIQFSILSSILGVFGALGISGYFFFYRKSNSSWWKKVLKFLAGFLLFALMFSATNFHYFTTDEFLAIILFFLLWILIVSRKGPKGKTATNLPNSQPSNNQPTHRNTNNNNINNQLNTQNQTISDFATTIIEEKNQPIHESVSVEKKSVQNSEMQIDLIKPTNPEEKVDSKSTSQNLNLKPLSFCSYCGKKIEFKSAFCPHCGHRLSSQNESAKVNSNQCSTKPRIKTNKTKIKKVVKKSCITLGILAILAGIGVGIWYYFDEIRPRQKAEKILASETWALNSLTGPLLLDKCEQITIDHDIPTCGDEWRDRSNLMKLTQIAWDKIKALAFSGNAKAQFELALLYNGYDFEENQWDTYQYDNGKYRNWNLDYGKAVYWYLQAAQQDLSDAQVFLGILYEEGKGVTKDIQKAIKWYRLAASNGDSRGELYLGDWFLKGYDNTHFTGFNYVWEEDPDYFYHDWYTKRGYKQVPKPVFSTETIIEQNIDSAIYYWKRSADHGNENALERLQKIYY